MPGACRPDDSTGRNSGADPRANSLSASRRLPACHPWGTMCHRLSPTRFTSLSDICAPSAQLSMDSRGKPEIVGVHGACLGRRLGSFFHSPRSAGRLYPSRAPIARLGSFFQIAPQRRASLPRPRSDRQVGFVFSNRLAAAGVSTQAARRSPGWVRFFKSPRRRVSLPRPRSDRQVGFVFSNRPQRRRASLPRPRSHRQVGFVFSDPPLGIPGRASERFAADRCLTTEYRNVFQAGAGPKLLRTSAASCG